MNSGQIGLSERHRVGVVESRRRILLDLRRRRGLEGTPAGTKLRTGSASLLFNFLHHAMHFPADLTVLQFYGDFLLLDLISIWSSDPAHTHT